MSSDFLTTSTRQLNIPYLIEMDRLPWKQVKKILEAVRGQFRAHSERKFVEDLIGYLYQQMPGTRSGT